MTDVYGFTHEDMEAARKAVESALSIRLEESPESDGLGNFFHWRVPSDPWVQIHRNSGRHQRWTGDPSNPWHPDYKLLVFVHGPARESVAHCLKHSVPGLSFLESQRTMSDYVPPRLR